MGIETLAILAAIGGVGAASVRQQRKTDKKADERALAIEDTEPLRIEEGQLAKDAQDARQRRVSRDSLRIDPPASQGLRIQL